MDLSQSRNRGLGVLLLVALAAAALAPAAEAGRGHGRYQGIGPVYQGPRVVRVVHRGPYLIERHSEAGALAGFLGGLVLGSMISNARPAPPPPPAYEYYDPYCRERFLSLDAYGAHLCHHRHPRSIDVIEVHSGRCVDTYAWTDGRWCSRDDRPPYEDWDE